MLFDFYNYTFSAAISFVTAIFGMSYPLLIESIHKIDERYHSRHLKARFENSFVFRMFNFILVFSVFTAVCIPFLLAATESMELVRYILISLQMIILFLLSLQTILLVRQIQLYNNPSRLLKYILQTATRKDLNAIIDITKYYSPEEDVELYKQGMQWIVQLITEENIDNGRN